MKNFEKWVNELGSPEVEKYFRHCDECPANKYCENADKHMDCTTIFKQWALTDVEEE